jgi:hypothetical protein
MQEPAGLLFHSDIVDLTKLTCILEWLKSLIENEMERVREGGPSMWDL